LADVDTGWKILGSESLTGRGAVTQGQKEVEKRGEAKGERVGNRWLIKQGRTKGETGERMAIQDGKGWK